MSRDPNTPSDGMRVGLFLAGQQVDATVVDAGGNFLFERLGPGKYSVRAIGVALEELGPVVTIALSKGTSVKDVEIDVLAGASIRGIVRHPSTLAPLPRVPVTLVGPNDFLASAATDSNGEYSFDGLGLGDHRVALPISGPATSQLVTIMDVDRAIYTADLAFEGVAHVGGRLRLRDGTAPTNGGVGLYEAGEHIATAAADENGDYWFDFVREGTFDLCAYATEGTFEVITNVVVTSGASVVQDMAAGSASLTVTATDPVESVEGALMFLNRVLGQDEELVGVVELLAHGVSSFTGLAPGEYLAEVLGDGNRFGRGALSVQKGGTAVLDIAMKEAYVLSGLIIDTIGHAVPSAVITLVPKDDAGRQTVGVSGPDGRYKVTNVPAGTYDVVFARSGFGTEILEGVHIAEDHTLDEVLSLVVAQIAGRLVDAQRLPITAAAITVMDADNRVVGDTVSDLNGEFVVDVMTSDSLTMRYAPAGSVPVEIGGLTIGPGTHNLGEILVVPVAIGSTTIGSTAFDKTAIGTFTSAAGTFPAWLGFFHPFSWMKSLPSFPEPPWEPFPPCGARKVCVESYKASVLAVQRVQIAAQRVYRQEMALRCDLTLGWNSLGGGVQQGVLGHGKHSRRCRFCGKRRPTACSSPEGCCVARSSSIECTHQGRGLCRDR